MHGHAGSVVTGADGFEYPAPARGGLEGGLAYPLELEVRRNGAAWRREADGMLLAVYGHDAYQLPEGARSFTPAPGGCPNAVRCAGLWAHSLRRPVSVWMRAIEELAGRVWIVAEGRPDPDVWGPVLWISTEH